MIYKKKILAMSVALILSNNAYSIPHGFEDLYELKNGKIKFIVNDEYIIELNAKYSSESVEIDKSELNKLESNLEETFLNNKAKKKIISDLTHGVKSSSQCKGKRDVCIPEDNNNISYIVINNQKIVRVLTPSSYLDSNNKKKKYISITNKNKALISEHDLSFDMYDDTKSNYYYRNSSYLGLGPGYVSSDFDLSEKSNDNDFELNELAYNFLSESTRVRFGYSSDFVEQNWNGTGLLDTNASENIFGLTIGSTKQLEFENKQTSQRIFFSSPANGRLTVYRNDKPVLEKNIGAGQNYLSLNELPQGIYDVDLVVKSGDKVVFKEKRTIFNKSKYNLNKGDLDYTVTIGNYEKKNIYKNLDYGNENEIEYDDRAMINGKVAYKISDSIIIGSEVGILESDSFYKAALDYQITNDLNMSSVVNLFSNNSKYYQIDALYKNLSIQFSSYTDNHPLTEQPKIDNYFYGIGDNEQLSVSYSQSILTGDAYISYINQKNNKSNYKNQINLYNIGYTLPIFHDSYLSINYSYMDSEYNYDTDDDWSVDVSLEIPIGNFDSVRYTGNFDDNGESNRVAYNHYIDLTDSISGNIETGIKYNNREYESGNIVSDASLSLSQNSSIINSSLYGYADSNGYASLSMNLNTNTIVTMDDLYLSSSNSDAYLALTNASYKKPNSTDSFSSVANIKRNNELSQRVHIDNDIELIPVDNYKEYQVSIDTDASDFYNQGDDFVKSTTAPGTVINMDLRLYNVDSYISIFNDLSGSPVSNIKCIGDGCYGVQEIQDGVYKIRVARGQPFKLVTNNDRCFIPSSDAVVSNNLGENFCMPATEDENGIQVAKIKNRYYYYVGMYGDKDMFINTARAIYNDVDKQFVFRNAGNHTMVFLSSDGRVSEQEKENINILQNYALDDTKVKSDYVKL
ncbi:CS1-pili formation C-terminal domain-containing protein [Photobacterium damselae]|uniref:CS1-pili formation C-terminal domain-containing protein n=1 Tax=Photobacterium damselae TaxID=38293 RepID=UPI0015A3C835|nr:CS1-pili formation C-terminal domain-containing protein [Photobacterium damselae]NVO60802.1 CS1-pili formation C-terminal domain-containing protein [Photobacterium damselae subsp. damselae]